MSASRALNLDTGEVWNTNPCWDCIKGRHLICTGRDTDDGTDCVCPVPHDGRSRRAPVLVDGTYSDPGPESEPRRLE